VYVGMFHRGTSAKMPFRFDEPGSTSGPALVRLQSLSRPSRIPCVGGERKDFFCRQSDVTCITMRPGALPLHPVLMDQGDAILRRPEEPLVNRAPVNLEDERLRHFEARGLARRLDIHLLT
jgi:hypothetical protein